MEFDYVIVGGGPAGCVLAGRLSEDPDVKICLLEAGKRDRHPYIHMPAGFAKLTNGRADWGWSTVPQKHIGNRPYSYPQGKILGGGSSINAQLYNRGNAGDFDRWRDEAGCSGWGFAECLPYFRRSEGNEVWNDAFHGSEGPLGIAYPVNPLPVSKAFIRAGQQAGLPHNTDFNGARQEGVGFYQLTQRAARRCSAAGAYLHPAMKRGSIELLTEALATRIIVERGRAAGVEISRGGKVETVRARREVLVTAGAIGSPRLLLLSGIGPADELRGHGIAVQRDLPGVGRNLQDHVDVYVVSELKAADSYDHVAKLHHTLWAGIQYVLFRKGPVASNLVDAGGFWFADDGERYPDIQFHFMLGSGLEQDLKRLDQDGVTLNSAFLRPRSRGSVTLPNADPKAAPNIDPNYWADPYDRAMSIKGFRVARQIMAQPALQALVRREALPGPDVETDDEIAAYAGQHAKTDYHPVATCAMGPDDDAHAVVDLELKVRGIEGLRVCDSAAMPLLVSANTNAATIMLAEKAADLIRGHAPLPVIILSEAEPATAPHEKAPT
ncbi:MAG: GMC family oxidoreductase N-terminal domain-containing protein [Pseudomonadota bacterium]